MVKRPTKEGLQTDGSSIADLLVQAGRKQFGEDTVSTTGLSEIDYFLDTGCFALNTAIGRDGVPSGRLTVIQGKESTGKTTLALQILAECQRQGGITVYLEAESAYEKDRGAALGLYERTWVEKLGLTGQIEPLITVSPAHIQEAFSMIEFYVTQARVLAPDKKICIVWDSVAATPSTAEAADDNKDYGNVQPGLPARQVSSGFRRLSKIISKNQVVLICTNFIKEKINTGFGGFGDNTATIAQRPLGQHASIRIQLINMGVIKEGKKPVGLKVLAKLDKNKIAPPKKEANFELFYEKGTDNEGSMLDMAKERGIVQVAGAYLKYNDINFRASNFAAFEYHDSIIEELKRQVQNEQSNALAGWKPDEEIEEIEDE